MKGGTSVGLAELRVMRVVRFFSSAVRGGGGGGGCSCWLGWNIDQRASWISCLFYRFQLRSS